MIPALLKEMDQESKTTRKMLELIPTEKFSWKPHPKSMSLQQLATHLAELPGWISLGLDTTELDFAVDKYDPPQIADSPHLMEYFEQCLQKGRGRLEQAQDAALEEIWTLRNGEQILQVYNKAELIRMAYCQIVHHRAQLGVCLRLLDIPIPGSYGPSADDPKM
jgi:uncharacterized damage-inducible protein DinB